MIHGKHLRGGAASRAYNRDEARGKGYREGGTAAHRGGNIRGGERESGAGEEGRQARRAKKFGVSEWYGCSSSRVRIYIYIAAIYSIFIYILSIYL